MMILPFFGSQTNHSDFVSLLLPEKEKEMGNAFLLTIIVAFCVFMMRRVPDWKHCYAALAIFGTLGVFIQIAKFLGG